MTDIIMIGAGGCMRELTWQILEDSKKTNRWNIIGYVDDKSPEFGDKIDVGGFDVPYLGDDRYLLNSHNDINVVLSVGSSKLRSKIVNQYFKNKHLHFPNIILKSAYVCKDLKIGQGCIIAMDARVSTNVTMGNFVFMNTGSLVCHDSILGDYVTFSPRSQIAGSVAVGNNVEIGMNATIIQNLKIGNNVIVGAGATVVRDVENDCTVIGVPARKVGC